MGFLKGIFNFVVMVILGLCLLLWLSYGLMNDSILSLSSHKEMMETTSFSQEVTDELLSRYHMSLNELRFDDDVLLQFVNDSGLGVLGYVFLEYDQMPDVDVTFLKDYVVDEVAKETMSRMEGNVDVTALVTALRAVPDGDSITSSIKNYTLSKGLEISQSDIDKVAGIYLENKEKSDEDLIKLIVDGIATEKLNLDEMNTNLSLQNLFDQLMTRNPFTLLRDIYEVVDKDFGGYLPITIALLVLLIIVVEFRVGTSALWVMLSMLFAIVPLQLIRLADFFIQKDFLDIMGGLESYKNFMMQEVIHKLNVYTIVFAILIIILFILSKVSRKQIDNRIEAVEEKRQSRFVWPRVAVFAVLAVALYLNVNAAKDYNMNLVDEVRSIEPSDFDPESVDLILRNELNIDFDF